jgi:CheY-like chemotaxis protein
VVDRRPSAFFCLQGVIERDAGGCKPFVLIWDMSPSCFEAERLKFDIAVLQNGTLGSKSAQLRNTDMKNRALHGRPLRVLYVEDEKDVREAIRMMIEITGHQVVEACDGAEALVLLEKEEFDLLLTDLSMPKMRGDELATRARAMRPAMPIVMLTAYSTNPQKDVDVLMTKPPPSMNWFFNGLEQAVRIRAAATQAPPAAGV